MPLKFSVLGLLAVVREVWANAACPTKASMMNAAMVSCFGIALATIAKTDWLVIGRGSFIFEAIIFRWECDSFLKPWDECIPTLSTPEKCPLEPMVLL